MRMEQEKIQKQIIGRHAKVTFALTDRTARPPESKDVVLAEGNASSRALSRSAEFVPQAENDWSRSAIMSINKVAGLFEMSAGGTTFGLGAGLLFFGYRDMGLGGSPPDTSERSEFSANRTFAGAGGVLLGMGSALLVSGVIEWTASQGEWPSDSKSTFRYWELGTGFAVAGAGTLLLFLGRDDIAAWERELDNNTTAINNNLFSSTAKAGYRKEIAGMTLVGMGASSIASSLFHLWLDSPSGDESAAALHLFLDRNQTSVFVTGRF